MQYMGGKGTIGARIAEVIEKLTPSGRPWVEPFVGLGGVLAKIDPKRYPVRLVSDVDTEVIALWHAVLDGWDPPSSVTREEYAAIKADKTAPPHLRAFVGYGCSFGGKYFRGYAADNVAQLYAAGSRASLLRKATAVRGAQFLCVPYDAVKVPSGAVVYCDPPYAGTGAPGRGGAFDSSAFWEWANKLDSRCFVFVSEYTAPAGWREVWRMPGRTTMASGMTGQGMESRERMFVRESRLPLRWR